MRRLAGARILVAGLNGLGVEMGARDGTLCFALTAASARPPARALARPDLARWAPRRPRQLVARAERSPRGCPVAAKNVILAGVAAVTLADTATVQLRDLSAHFYLDEGDVGRNRAEACCPKLHELNPAVNVAAHTAPLTEAFLKNFEARRPCSCTWRRFLASCVARRMRC